MKLQKLLLFGTIFLICLVFGLLIFWKPFDRAAATEEKVFIESAQLRGEDSVNARGTATSFSLFTDTKPIYKSTSLHETAALELLRRNISVANASTLLPDSFLKNSRLIKMTDDASDPLLQTLRLSSNKKHYYYQQTIGGRIIYGSHVAIHVQNDNEVYAISGAVTTSDTVESPSVSADQAADNARRAFSVDYNLDQESVSVIKKEQIIYNAAVAGESSNDVNIPAVSVSMSGLKNADERPAATYLVSQVDGSVLTKRQDTPEALTRNVYDCTVNNTCTLARSEGGAPVSDVSTNKIYDFVGDTYNFYKNRFGRDSYDGKGAPVRVEKHVCEAYAYWYAPPINIMWYCTVHEPFAEAVAHEFTHGVLFATPGLIYNELQAGSIHEGVSTLMASGVKPENDYADAFNPLWSETVETLRLFAPAYTCDNSRTVHYNGFLLRHAFYLMGHGGTYNTCTVPPIGKTKTLNIWYRMLTTYMPPSANFRSVADGLIQACKDLYGVNSQECITTTNAVKAVEIDQQPVGEQRGAKCVGVERRAPGCTVITSPTPSPTKTPTPSPSPTRAPTTNPDTCPTKSQGDADCNGTVSITDYAVWKTEFKGGCTSTNLTAAACGDNKDTRGSLMDADFGGDGRVSLIDYSTWKGVFTSN